MNDDKTYSVFIAEDMVTARKLLIDFVSANPNLILADTAEDGEEALKKLSANTYDLLLLDIHLPLLSGIEVLEQLEKKPYVIFTTAHDRYAIKAFELGAIDYLLKPFSKKRFNQSIDRFLLHKNQNISYTVSPEEVSLSFREEGKSYLLAYQEIIYLSSHGKHTIIHTEEKDFETPIILKDIEKKLPSETFFRLHKQFIVNVQHASHLQYNEGGKYMLFLNDHDDSFLPVGRMFAPQLKDKFKDKLKE
ncbi:MAG: response regulator transcription factor [bacterium]|nr:response regulator transcription factor [bacterium]